MMTQFAKPKKWGHTPTPWIFDKLEMKIKGEDEFGNLVIISDMTSLKTYSSTEIQQGNALRIVECVNAMGSISDPSNLRATWDAIQHLELDKYHKLKEVIQNMVDRLDEGSEMTLTKDSIIVHCLKEAIK